MSTFGAFAEVRPYRIWAGAVARAVEGERMTVAIVDLEPDVLVPEHTHENEQIGFVLKGAITMTVGGDARLLGPGETYRIPSGVPHGAMAGPEGASVMDAFAPVRGDWQALETDEPGRGAWPE